MNKINVSGIICNDIKSGENLSRVDLIGIKDEIVVDSTMEGEIKLVLFFNGFLEKNEVDTELFLIHKEAEKQLNLGITKIERERAEEAYVNLKSIIEIKTVFPVEGEYSILVKIYNNAIEDSLVEKFNVVIK